MTLAKYLTGNKFGLWIDLRSMADTTMHGNGQRLTRSIEPQDGHHKLQLEISDSQGQPQAQSVQLGATQTAPYSSSPSQTPQMNIMGQQLESVQY